MPTLQGYPHAALKNYITAQTWEGGVAGMESCDPRTATPWQEYVHHQTEHFNLLCSDCANFVVSDKVMAKQASGTTEHKASRISEMEVAYEIATLLSFPLWPTYNMT